MGGTTLKELNAAQKAAIAEIEKQMQQATRRKGTVYHAGEQLRDICRREPDSAQLILTDMALGEKHGIAAAEQKIREYCRGVGGGCSDSEAEDVLRRFYGLGGKTEEAPGEEEPREMGGAEIIDLADYL